MDTSKPRAAIVRVKLSQNIRGLLQQTCDRWGVDQIRVISRIIEWVATQPPDVSVMIFVLNRPDCHNQIAKLIFEDMSHCVDKKIPTGLLPDRIEDCEV